MLNQGFERLPIFTFQATTPEDLPACQTPGKSTLAGLERGQGPLQQQVDGLGKKLGAEQSIEVSVLVGPPWRGDRWFVL